MYNYPKLSVKRVVQLAVAEVNQYMAEYGYKIYVTEMLRRLVQPLYQSPIAPWYKVEKKTPKSEEASVDDIINDVIARSGAVVKEGEL